MSTSGCWFSYLLLKLINGSTEKCKPDASAPFMFSVIPGRYVDMQLLFMSARGFHMSAASGKKTVCSKVV